MKYHRPINWNEVPDVITKEQFYRICHISKSTALYLLKNGVVPCEYSGKKTRCYKIKKADVQKYLESKGKFPEYYSVSKGWYKGNYKITLPVEMSEEALKLLHEYYADLLSDYKDVITSQEVVKLTGYAKSTVTNWCGKGRLKYFAKNNTYYIPKVFLIEFFCSPYFRSIVRKTSWHIQTINEFTTLCRKNEANEAFEHLPSGGCFFNVRFQNLHNRTPKGFLLHYSRKEVQTMARFIEEFYYGNIDPQARNTKQNKAAQKQMEILMKNEDLLTNALHNEQKKWFLDYVNAWGVVNGESNLDSLKLGVTSKEKSCNPSGCKAFTIFRKRLFPLFFPLRGRRREKSARRRAQKAAERGAYMRPALRQRLPRF